MEFSFALKFLANFSVNPGKVYIEVHISRYINYNKSLVLKYYVNMNDSPVSDLLRQVSIKTENHLVAFLIIVGNIVQKLEEVHDHTVSLIQLDQFTMSHMFQDQLLNQVQKLSTIQHALQE